MFTSYLFYCVFLITCSWLNKKHSYISTVHVKFNWVTIFSYMLTLHLTLNLPLELHWEPKYVQNVIWSFEIFTKATEKVLGKHVPTQPRVERSELPTPARAKWSEWTLVWSHRSASPITSEVMCPQMIRRIFQVSKAWYQLFESVFGTSGAKLSPWTLQCIDLFKYL